MASTGPSIGWVLMDAQEILELTLPKTSWSPMIHERKLDVHAKSDAESPKWAAHMQIIYSSMVS